MVILKALLLLVLVHLIAAWLILVDCMVPCDGILITLFFVVSVHHYILVIIHQISLYIVPTKLIAFVFCILIKSD